MRKVPRVPIGGAIVSLLVLTACAAQPQANGSASPPVGRDCFNVQFLTGYETMDRDTLKLRAGPCASYEVDISGAQCSQIDWAHRVAIESSPSSWICVGNQPGQGTIAFRDPTTRRRVECFIEAVRPAPQQDGTEQ